MQEVWKDIVGYEGLYQVSNLGRVKSLERLSKNLSHIKEKIMTPQFKRGYYHILFNKKCYRVHRLVAQAFIPNPNSLPEVNHINGIKTDNRVDNLEWVSHDTNMKHASQIINHMGSAINQYNLNGEFIKTWKNGSDAANYLNASASNIYKVCNNKRKSAYGYIWSYEKK